MGGSLEGFEYDIGEMMSIQKDGEGESSFSNFLCWVRNATLPSSASDDVLAKF